MKTWTIWKVDTDVLEALSDGMVASMIFAFSEMLRGIC
jgi:hypothetical protein